jgi:hypothetical protein
MLIKSLQPGFANFLLSIGCFRMGMKLIEVEPPLPARARAGLGVSVAWQRDIGTVSMAEQGKMCDGHHHPSYILKGHGKPWKTTEHQGNPWKSIRSDSKCFFVLPIL